MDNCIVDTKSWIQFFYDIVQRCIDEINELGASVDEQTIQKLYLKLVELESTICQGTKFIQDIISNIEYEQEKVKLGEKDSSSFFTPYPPNTLVAVRRDSPHDDEWMLAIVISFNPITLQYLVEDYSEDEDDNIHGRLSGNEDLQNRKRFIAAPHRVKNIPESDAIALKQKIFSKNHIVLALYPSTTVLYKAIVTEIPTISNSPAYQMTHANSNYQVQFENDVVDGVIPTRNVPARYVLDLQIDGTMILEDTIKPP